MTSMWNPKVEEEEEDDSWEIKAFEQDINGNNMGTTTWPPRSYTCNFCRREFRSAQALGGHMNVHRRDRAAARVRRKPRAGSGLISPNSLPSSSSSSSFVSAPSSTLILQFPRTNNNPNIILGRTIDQSPLPTTNFIPSIEFHPYLSSDFAFPAGVHRPDPSSSVDYARYSYGKPKNFQMGDNIINHAKFNGNNHNQPGEFEEPAAADGLDLELRLGNKAAAPR